MVKFYLFVGLDPSFLWLLNGGKSASSIVKEYAIRGRMISVETNRSPVDSQFKLENVLPAIFFSNCYSINGMDCVMLFYN